MTEATTTPARPQVTRQQAAEMLLRLREASQSFLGFVRLHKPKWKIKPFHMKLIETLDKLEKGELMHPAGHTIRNVLINWPPRHAKTEYATKLFPAYYIARRSNRKVLASAYNERLAMDFGGAVREYLEHPLTLKAFGPELYPERPLALDQSSRAKELFRTIPHGPGVAGGGGQVAFVGVDGTTTGRPANLLLIDDPIKNRKEADSPTYRNRIWSDYNSALLTRQEPDDENQAPPIQVVIHTRWHPDDLAGRIMDMREFKTDWLHLNEPAIQTVDSGVTISVRDLPPDDPRHVPKSTPLGNLNPSRRYVSCAKEVALWEEQVPLKELLKRRELNPREFASLYQQSPYIEGGNLVKSTWWRYFKADFKPENFMSLVVACDTAFKTNEQADYSVLLFMGMDRAGDIYIIDCIRERYDFPTLKRLIVSQNARWRGKGLRGFYIEDAASGQSLLQELRATAGVSAIAWKHHNRDLTARLQAVLGMIEGGRVLLPEQAPWLDAFLEEMQSFPSSEHDDQISALTIGLDVLSRIPIGTSDFSGLPFDPSGSLLSQVDALRKGSLASTMTAQRRPRVLGE